MTYLSKCAVRGCSFSGSAPALESLLTGPLGEQMSLQIKQRLVDHIKQKHPDVYKSFLKLGSQFAEWMALACFQTQDPFGQVMVDHMRWQLHNITRRPHPLTDEDIRGMVSQLGLPDLQQPRVVALICEVRDALLEQGKHEVKPPEAPAVQN